MIDGIYQSVVCYYMGHLLFAPGRFVTHNGLEINDRPRIGVYVACPTIVVVNTYVLMNMYRLDWLFLLLVAFSILLIWFWTGVYTAFSSSLQFYKAAPQVFGQLSFWAMVLLTVAICLLPRFAAKSMQKLYRPRDIDIIREQVRQGKFDYLNRYEAYVPPAKVPSAASSDASEPPKPKQRGGTALADDERPIYPPSVANTGTTHNPRSNNGSDETDYTGRHLSMDHPPRPSFDRPRPSFDRIRDSMDRIRPSFEASNDFTSAALLTRLESSHSGTPTRKTLHGCSSLR